MFKIEKNKIKMKWYCALRSTASIILLQCIALDRHDGRYVRR
jgi:hypothetical protein